MGALLNRRRYMGASAPAPAVDYLKLTAVADTTFTISIPSILTVANFEYLEYSLDNGGTWTKTNNVASTAVTVSIPLVSAGSSVLLRGKETRVSISNLSGNYTNISSDEMFDVSGNIMTLLGGADYATASMSQNYTFTGLFRGSKVRYANNLILYNGALYPYCYQSMFYDCTNLISTPEINYTTAANYCCYAMFRGCTSLVNTQASLPSSIATQCFGQMYQGCTSLVNAPALPATTLISNCYNGMFSGCSSLQYLKCMSLTELGTSYTQGWVFGTHAGGTFVKNSAATWTDTFSRSAVPSEAGAWTVVLADS